MLRSARARELKILFVSTINNTKGLEYGEGNPFFLRIRNQSFTVFLTNITETNNSKGITKASVNYNKHLKVLPQNFPPLVVLAYDVINDVYVTWTPLVLNRTLENNLVLHSRSSFQIGVSESEFKQVQLPNGEKVVVFKRIQLNQLFENIRQLFPKRKRQRRKYIESKELGSVVEESSVRRIDDEGLIKLLNPLLKENKVLEAVNICAKQLGHQYPEMAFKEWFHLVNQLYKESHIS